MKADRLHLSLLSDGTRTDENEYLSSLENGTEFIVCTEEQIQELSIYFELKRYLSHKNIPYPLNINYFLWLLFLNNFDVQFHRSDYKQYKFCSKCFLKSFRMTLKKRKEFERSKEQITKLSTTSNSWQYLIRFKYEFF